VTQSVDENGGEHLALIKEATLDIDREWRRSLSADKRSGRHSVLMREMESSQR
jgi:hypothetical protein